MEDEDDLRGLYRDWLKAAGFEVIEAADGIDALQIIDSSAPDLIILDIRLRTLDGVSVRQEIAADARTREIPVIVVTAADANVKQLKVARVLRKPIDRSDLIAAARATLLSHARKRTR